MGSLARLLYWFVCLGIMGALIVLAVNRCSDPVSQIGINLSETVYPKSLLDLLERNPETREFVLDYPKCKDAVPEIDLTAELQENTIPLFLQWDERWGYQKYGNDFMAITGCGPTCLSMIRCGLGGDDEWNPLKVAKMAEKNGFYVDGVGTSWELMTTGAKKLGLDVDCVIYDEAHVVAELKNGNPIICSMRPGVFTTSGHFIVLTGVDEKGKVTICDPNSRANSDRSWKMEELIPQIRGLWSYSYVGEN